MSNIKYIDSFIKKAWGDPNKVLTASDAHYRASEIERLEKIKQRLLKQ